MVALQWNWITPEYITLPREVAKNGVLHKLPNLMAEHFKLIPRNGPLLFGSSAGTPFSAWSKNKALLDKLSGVEDWVIHDLRRTFATKMAEWHITEPHVVERLLNHVTGSMTPLAKIYNRHSYAGHMREALEKYERRLAALIASD